MNLHINRNTNQELDYWQLLPQNLRRQSLLPDPGHRDRQYMFE
jgi:hypothetical protein